MSLIITLNKSQLLFKMRVAVQGLRMERNRRLLWDMTKIIFNSFMTILIFGLLIGMGKLNCERIIRTIRSEPLNFPVKGLCIGFIIYAIDTGKTHSFMEHHNFVGKKTAFKS